LSRLQSIAALAASPAMQVSPRTMSSGRTALAAVLVKTLDCDRPAQRTVSETPARPRPGCY
jgi:hypothetical protein